jgi:hypothetical protein
MLTSMERTKDMGRRPRIGLPQPQGLNVILDEDDDQTLQVLHEYGDLPVPYLHAFKSNKSMEYTRKRLNLLFHETGLLKKPKQQNRAPNSRSNTLVYSGNAVEYLKQKGLYNKYAPVMGENDKWFHDFIVSCVTASFDLAAPKGFVITKEAQPQYERLSVLTPCFLVEAVRHPQQ